MRHILKGLFFSVLSYISFELPASASQPITDIVIKVFPTAVLIIGEINVIKAMTKIMVVVQSDGNLAALSCIFTRI